MAALSLDRIADVNSFYSIDMYWSTRVVYALRDGADRILLRKGSEGEWNGIFRVGQDWFQIAKPMPSEPATDVRSGLLALFEEDAVWHYTKTNGSIGHRSIIIGSEIVEMWIWQNPDDADELYVDFVYNENVKELAASVVDAGA